MSDMTEQMAQTAAAMVAEGKGILAIDESLPTIKKRFDTINVESTEENRRAYRELLITAPGGEDFISGMILFDETLRQKTRDGVPFPQVMIEKGIMPGIKVDKGAKDLAGRPGEKVTEGLDGLRDRLAEYRDLGARFAKWRAVITIGDHIPTNGCIEANAHALARYAALCQEAGIVPMVEPEVLMDADNDIDVCYWATEKTLRTVFNALCDQAVALEHTILKTNMVLSGKKCPVQAGVQEVAEKTVRCLLNTVPASLPGIVFLSGGQSATLATAHLNEMNRNNDGLPWPLSFSYGRALQEPSLKTWAGNPENFGAAQAALLHREKCNSLACLGQYSDALEEAA
ncbi:MAG: fructose-bisphosphate aldolase class I [Gammaproteobacteria bacterium]|nr:fructose-bisphosphate aldolase class I [Gammaproteobacteria bacterium]